MTTRIAPPRTHGRLRRSFAGTTDESHAVDVDRFPVMSMHAEVQALISFAGKDHECTTVLAHFDDLSPETVSDAGAHASAVDTGTDLEEPSGQVTAKPNGASRENDDYHGGSSSPKFWPAATRPRVSQSSTTSALKSASSSPLDPSKR